MLLAAVAVLSAAALIDKQCAQSVDRALQSTPRAFVRMYGGGEKGRWYVLTPALQHRVATDPDIYSEIAQTWQVAQHLVLVNIEARSLELRADATYCFRSTGTLARVMESSSGVEVRDDEARYFDERGKLVGRRSGFSWLYPRPEETLSPDFKPSTPSLYLSVRALPFYALLSGK
jgi:hypothetical protein